ncbi:peptidoglycan DD-metalloendopeptidase family protein [Oceanobacter antarcticus]|uniref:Peptidoglycan DD-metalloendopeptidase family protein n=1 Tax=Oceanobacter antarcticus TaxID=3133425 RepID=A0ABW8NKW0_9GAMM
MKRLTAVTTAVTLVAIVAITSGCTTGSGFVSVEQKFGNSERPVYKKTERVEKSSGFHIVEKGDTLYSIAWRYGVDHHDLAKANGITSPYTIYPGQKIDVRATAAAVVTIKKPTPSRSVSKPAASVSIPPTPVDVPVVTGQNPPEPVVESTPNDWVWPVPGKIMAQFSTKKPVNKGIDLAGAMGESVSAAAAGTVVYAGQGLRGYGNLVIIKHDETYLSAYAHTSRILVSEKEVVKAGQIIAETGSTGTDKVKLHFEVRKNGKPVDPLLYLPKR